MRSFKMPQTLHADIPIQFRMEGNCGINSVGEETLDDFKVFINELDITSGFRDGELELLKDQFVQDKKYTYEAMRIAWLQKLGRKKEGA
jgi:hypothetical protein